MRYRTWAGLFVAALLLGLGFWALWDLAKGAR